jgi:hypothetical protein
MRTMLNKAIERRSDSAINYGLDLRAGVKQRCKGRLFCVAVFGLAIVFGSRGLAARGASLNLIAVDPDISAGFLNASYNASTGILAADGWPIGFTENGNSTPIDGGQYSLSVQLTSAGQPVPGTGTLDITGSDPSLGVSGTLLTGDLSDFGFQSGGGDIFEFVFNDLGGDLAPYYSSGESGVILDAMNSGFDGSFQNSFTASPYLSVSDNVSVVPEPSTLILLLAALISALAGFQCRLWWRGTVRHTSSG